MDFRLSESACKQLQEWGCDVPSKKYWGYVMKGSENDGYCLMDEDMEAIHGFPAYHILEDICCTHALEFFGDERAYRMKGERNSGMVHMSCPEAILYYMMNGEKELAEEHLLLNTVFNPDNK